MYKYRLVLALILSTSVSADMKFSELEALGGTRIPGVTIYIDGMLSGMEELTAAQSGLGMGTVYCPPKHAEVTAENAWQLAGDFVQREPGLSKEDHFGLILALALREAFPCNTELVGL